MKLQNSLNKMYFYKIKNDKLKESISRFNKGKEIIDGMISMTSITLKSKGGIDF